MTTIDKEPQADSADVPEQFTEASAAKLASSGIPLDRAEELDIVPVLSADLDGFAASLCPMPGMGLVGKDLDGTEAFIYRPDSPVADADGKLVKYVSQTGAAPALSHYRRAQPGKPWLLVEGQLQQRCAALYAPQDWGVTGMHGCWGFRGTDLTWATGQNVRLVPDADVAANRDVHDAMTELWECLEMEAAESVALVRLAGARSREGLDDVLGRRREDNRAVYLERLVDKAVPTLPRRPAKAPVSKYFNERGGLLAETLAGDVMAEQPCALTADDKIAAYVNGVFRIDGKAVQTITGRLLKEEYRNIWRDTVQGRISGILADSGAVIPDRVAEPLLNCPNGMLDLRTGELKEHSPEYLSRSQIAVEWYPDAQCPVFDAWLQQVVPDQAEELLDATSMMLDQSRTPSKAIFPFGPSRSGKSTYTRLLVALVGFGNCSGVSLHQLADDKFMASSLYGKMLNVSNDPSAKDVSDVGLFKQVTGDDLTEVQRKHEKAFRFYNSAMFAFTANNIPHVNDPSGAYLGRIKPFWFGTSYIGREDASIEAKMMEELPGILVRLVNAWQEHRVRGNYLPTNPAVLEQFVTRSDRVAKWVRDYCTVTEAVPGSTLPAAQATTRSMLYRMFTAKQDDDGGRGMGRDAFVERLMAVTGVVEVRISPSRANGLNVTAHSEHRDEAGPIGQEAGEPAAQAGEAGGFQGTFYGAQTLSPEIPGGDSMCPGKSRAETARFARPEDEADAWIARSDDGILFADWEL